MQNKHITDILHCTCILKARTYERIEQVWCVSQIFYNQLRTCNDHVYRLHILPCFELRTRFPSSSESLNELSYWAMKLFGHGWPTKRVGDHRPLLRYNKLLPFWSCMSSWRNILRPRGQWIYLYLYCTLLQCL